MNERIVEIGGPIAACLLAAFAEPFAWLCFRVGGWILYTLGLAPWLAQ